MHGILTIEDYKPVQELERIKLAGDQALVSTHFSTPHEKMLAECVQRNTRGWIDTAKDTLNLAVNMYGLGKTNKLLTINIYTLVYSKHIEPSNRCGCSYT